MSTHSYSPWWLPLLIAGISLASTIYLGYTKNDKDVASRLSVVETHQQDTDQRLDRIEAKIDRILEAWTIK